MTMQSSTTFVTAQVTAEDDELRAYVKMRREASVRLGGEAGLRIVTIVRSGDELQGTFLREWEEAPTPPPEPEKPEQHAPADPA